MLLIAIDPASQASGDEAPPDFYSSRPQREFGVNLEKLQSIDPPSYDASELQAHTPPEKGNFTLPVQQDDMATSRRIALERLEMLQIRDSNIEKSGDAPKQRRSSGLLGRLKDLKKPETAASGAPLQALATGLEEAAAAGNLGLVASYFELGADPNFRSLSKQETHKALPLAASRGHTEIVDYMCSRGANSYTINPAMLMASMYGHVDLVIKMITKYSADVNYRAPSPPFKTYKSGDFDFSVFYGTSCIQDEEKRLKLLRFIVGRSEVKLNHIVYRENYNSEAAVGYTPMALFSRRGCFGGVRLILEAGASCDVDADEFDRRRHHNGEKWADPLDFILAKHWTERPNETLEIFRLILARKSNYNRSLKKKVNWHSPDWFRAPIEADNLEAVKILLKEGADLMALMHDPNGIIQLTPLGLACKLGRTEIAGFLLKDAGADPMKGQYYPSQTPIQLAYEAHSESIVALLSSQPLRKSREVGLTSLLQQAIVKNQPAMVSSLLSAGADPSQPAEAYQLPTETGGMIPQNCLELALMSRIARDNSANVQNLQKIIQSLKDTGLDLLLPTGINLAIHASADIGLAQAFAVYNPGAEILNGPLYSCHFGSHPTMFTALSCAQRAASFYRAQELQQDFIGPAEAIVNMIRDRGGILGTSKQGLSSRLTAALEFTGQTWPQHRYELDLDNDYEPPSTTPNV